MNTVSGIKSLHLGQLVIVWLILSASGIAAVFVGSTLSSSAEDVRYRRELVRVDSSARIRYKGGGLSDSIDARFKSGHSEDQIESYMHDTIGLNPVDFRKPTSTEIRNSYLERVGSWLLMVVAAVSAPLALAITWIWFGGRSQHATTRE